jgi:hypothetical protein
MGLFTVALVLLLIGGGSLVLLKSAGDRRSRRARNERARDTGDTASESRPTER